MSNGTALWGKVKDLMKQVGTKQKLSAAKQAQLAKVITYMENNRANMKYMEGTGMRWRIPGAQAILSLRAVYINGDWESFQAHRIRTQTQGLYPHERFIRHLYQKTG